MSLTKRFYYVGMLPPEEKLTIYKKVKGYFLFESGEWNLNDFKPVLNEKLKDVLEILDYSIINYMEIYKDYSYGRY